MACLWCLGMSGLVACLEASACFVGPVFWTDSLGTRAQTIQARTWYQKAPCVTMTLWSSLERPAALAMPAAAFAPSSLQWDAFTMPELHNFLRILQREEEEHLRQILQKYSCCRQKIQEALHACPLG